MAKPCDRVGPDITGREDRVIHSSMGVLTGFACNDYRSLCSGLVQIAFGNFYSSFAVGLFSISASFLPAVNWRTHNPL